MDNGKGYFIKCFKISQITNWCSKDHTTNYFDYQRDRPEE